MGEDFDSRNWIILVHLIRIGYSPKEARKITADLESGKIENMDGIKPKEKHDD
jgi:hypothetical protein